MVIIQIYISQFRLVVVCGVWDYYEEICLYLKKKITRQFLPVEFFCELNIKQHFIISIKYLKRILFAFTFLIN